MTSRSVLGGILGFLALGLMLYLCALPGDLPADRSTEPGLVGTYTVNGIDPVGDEYSGTVVIVATDRADEFEVEWIVTGGIQRGLGRQLGTRFEVEWTTVTSGGGADSGTATYTIEDDGRLLGSRSVEGTDAVGTEEIFPDP